MWNTGSWCILLKNIIYQSGKSSNTNTNTNTTNNTNNNTNGLSLTTKKRVDIAIYPLKSNLLDLEVSLLWSDWSSLCISRARLPRLMQFQLCYLESITGSNSQDRLMTINIIHMIADCKTYPHFIHRVIHSRILVKYIFFSRRMDTHIPPPHANPWNIYDW